MSIKNVNEINNIKYAKEHMMTNPNQLENNDSDHDKAPMTLTLRDVVLIIAAVISMATAWGMFGTRLSVVEQKVISIGGNLVQIRQIIKELRVEDITDHTGLHLELEKLEARLRAIENEQAELKGLLHLNKI